MGLFPVVFHVCRQAAKFLQLYRLEGPILVTPSQMELIKERENLKRSLAVQVASIRISWGCKNCSVFFLSRELVVAFCFDPCGEHMECRQCH